MRVRHLVAPGPLLGMPDPSRPYRPDDDRIVDLAVHRHVDDTLVHDVVVTGWRGQPSSMARLK